MEPWAAPPRLLPRIGPGLCTRAGPRDPHSVLGIGPEASPAEIRAAFLERCKEVHPDGDPSDPSRHERFLLLAEAYEALTQPRPPPGASPGAPPGAPPRPKAGATGAGAPPRPKPPPRTDPDRLYWEQFRPPRKPRGPPWRVLGLCLVLATLGGVAHALAYRYVTGAHTAFLNERDRVLTAVYERARSRAGSHEEVLRRLRASRQRGRGEA